MSSGCAETSDVVVDVFATSEILPSPCRSALNGLRDYRRAEFQLDVTSGSKESLQVTIVWGSSDVRSPGRVDLTSIRDPQGR